MSDTPAPSTGGKSPFMKDFHGLPVWGWLVILVTVGGGVYYLSSHRNVTKKKTAANANTQDTPQGAGYTTVGYMPPTTTAEITRILTNSEWSQAAQKDLVQKGHDAADSADAVAKYIAGETITSAERQLIDIALVDIGPLPETPGGGQISKVSPLHTAQGGNIFGQLIAGAAGLLGLNDPNNPFAPYIDPFLNNIIDEGPVSGVFTSAQEVIGGNVNASGNIAPVYIPGVGMVGGNVNVGTSGVSGGVNTPGGSGSIGVTPNQSLHYSNYTVQSGDTLASISTKVYGNTGGAAKIYSSNIGKIPNPSHLAPGTVLQIPAANSNA